MLATEMNMSFSNRIVLKFKFKIYYSTHLKLKANLRHVPTDCRTDVLLTFRFDWQWSDTVLMIALGTEIRESIWCNITFRAILCNFR